MILFIITKYEKECEYLKLTNCKQLENYLTKNLDTNNIYDSNPKFKAWSALNGKVYLLEVPSKNHFSNLNI